jgi:hypothetical protein
MSDLVSEKVPKVILKMNFNFNFKDMPLAPQASIHPVTNGRDRHHTGKYGIKRCSRRGQLRSDKRFPGAPRARIKSLSEF